MRSKTKSVNATKKSTAKKKAKQKFMRMTLVDDEGIPIGTVDIPMPPAGGWSCLYSDPFGNTQWVQGLPGPRRFQKINKDDGPDYVA